MNTQDASEPPLIQRVLSFFTSSIKLQDEPIVSKPTDTVKTDDIEMTTFSMVSSQSPGVSLAMCCSVAGTHISTPRGGGSSKRPASRHKRYSTSTKRRSGNGRHLIYRGALGSPVRRSPRLTGRRTPLGVKLDSPSSLVRSSAKNQHAFKVFNTPTPLRRSQVRPLHRHSPSSLASPPLSVMSPDLRMSPDVELVAFSVTEKRLDFT